MSKRDSPPPTDSVTPKSLNAKFSPSRSSASPARAAAFDILLRVERESSYAAELLHSHKYESLTRLDHSLTTEIVMGVLRWRALLDAEISGSSSQPLSKLDPEILTALRLGTYQLRWLTRIPARAAINESVELVKRARKRSAAPFVNAVLRKLTSAVSEELRSQPFEVVGDSPQTIADRSAHPLWLVQRWVQAYGLESTRRIAGHNQSIKITAVRLRHPQAEAQLRTEGIDLIPGGLLAAARRVQNGDLTNTAACRSGHCVIQDEASQLVAAMLGTGAQILDCCAAPGGKTLALADHNPKSRIIAAELHSHRARLLRSLVQAHHPAGERETGNIYVVAADACHLPFVNNFDRILVDAPCSGTGTLSRNPEIKWRLTEKDLSDLHRRQLEIVRSAMAQLTAGGRLFYSTCSLEREENEDVVEQVLAENKAYRVVPCEVELKRLQLEGELTCQDLSSLTSGPYLRTLPGVHPCDGFFCAILERMELLAE